MKNKIELSLIIVIIGLLILSTVFTFGIIYSNKTIHSQKEHIKDLNREIGEYKAMDSFWEEYLDLIEDIYEGKINEAVLEERIYWLKLYNKQSLEENDIKVYTEEYVSGMYNDFDDLIEIIIFYYEETNRTVDVETYVSTNYPALYARIIKY